MNRHLSTTLLDVLGRIHRRVRARNGMRAAPTIATVSAGIDQLRGAELEPLYTKLQARVEDDERTALYGLKVYRSVHGWLERHAGGAWGKRVLELGPGHTLVTGALLVAAGVDRYVGADLFPLARHDAAPYRLARAEIERGRDPLRMPGHEEARSAMRSRFDAAVRMEGDQVRFEESRLSWEYPVDATKLPFPDASFDVCMSNACFEHFRDPEAAARECLRVVVRGGVNLHQIDLRDHRDFSRPLGFLRFETADWEGLFRVDGPPPPAERGPYTNRWRLGDHVRAFERAGGQVVSVEVNLTTPVTDELRTTLHPDFRERTGEDLETLGAFLVVRRP